MSRVDTTERWRVLYPNEREVLAEALAEVIERRRGSDYWLPEQRILARMLKQLREVERRPRPKIMWWDIPAFLRR